MCGYIGALTHAIVWWQASLLLPGMASQMRHAHPCCRCHVMERESFESEETAALMNQLFVNVKVDREERPDVDKGKGFCPCCSSVVKPSLG